MVILLGAITIAAQDMRFKVRYEEHFDLDVTQVLLSVPNVTEEFVVDLKRREFTHITPKKTQVYDIVNTNFTGEDDEFFNMVIKSRETSYFYEYTISFMPNDTKFSDIVVLTKTDKRIICYYGVYD